jgi:phage protein D
MVQANRNLPLVPAFSVALSEPSRTPRAQDVARDVLPWITSVSVDDYADQPAGFTLELISREEQNGTLTWTDDERFVLGANVAVSLGYGSRLEVMFVGEITHLMPAFSADGAARLVVKGADLRHRLSTVRRIRAHKGKLSEIAEGVCDKHVPVQATDSGVIIPHLLQDNKTDLLFLQECARRIHYELVMSDRTLLFRPIQTRSAPIATLTLDDDLLEFAPVLKLLPLTRMEAPGWDFEKKAPLNVSVGDDSAVGMGGTQSAAQQTARVLGDSPEALPDLSASTQAELDQVTRALWEAAALEHITGSGRCRGRTDLRAGTIVRIDGVGKIFSGDYYVESTSHSCMRGGDYVTSFQVRRNAS